MHHLLVADFTRSVKGYCRECCCYNPTGSTRCVGNLVAAESSQAPGCSPGLPYHSVLAAAAADGVVSPELFVSPELCASRRRRSEGADAPAARSAERVQCELLSCSVQSFVAKLDDAVRSRYGSLGVLVFVYRLFTVCLRTLEAWVVCSQTVLFTNSLFSCLFTELRS